MRLKLWPNTLAVQLIVVTGVSVTLSNIAVAFWFEYGNEQQSAIAANERVLDRAAAIATTLAAIPPSSRHVVLTSMSGRLWKFQFAPVPKAPLAMSADEKILAKHLGDLLPDKVPNQGLISVQVERPLKTLPVDALPPHAADAKTAIQAIVPIDKKTMLSGVFVRIPAAWPMEIFVAAVVAIILASLGAAVGTDQGGLQHGSGQRHAPCRRGRPPGRA
jgi:hypothetical protein